MLPGLGPVTWAGIGPRCPISLPCPPRARAVSAGPTCSLECSPSTWPSSASAAGAMSLDAHAVARRRRTTSRHHRLDGGRCPGL